jgi:hypothetical protein
MLFPIRRFKLQTGNLTPPNWVRFAHLPSGVRPRAGEIGFVLHNRPPAGHRFRPPRAHFQAREAKLGSFCAFRLRRPPWAGVPTIRNPQSALRNREIGFVLHVSLPGRPLPIRNPQSAIRNREIGFVLHISLRGRATPHTTAFAHIPQSLQVWLRFAQSPPSAACGLAKLGSFCTFGLRRLPPPPGAKFEARISKSETSSNDRNSKVPNPRISPHFPPSVSFAICICFGFRASDFELPGPGRELGSFRT